MNDYRFVGGVNGITAFAFGLRMIQGLPALNYVSLLNAEALSNTIIATTGGSEKSAAPYADEEVLGVVQLVIWNQFVPNS